MQFLQDYVGKNCTLMPGAVPSSCQLGDDRQGHHGQSRLGDVFTQMEFTQVEKTGSVSSMPTLLTNNREDMRDTERTQHTHLLSSL